ncbi:protein SPT2 homolog isoform X2 [Gigantopelta aegis]|uniref:protein SPT2 homolog isoform X2 n=1 Tax=Gigantopelta aegis TaxID=1735272 RepID=UPI001B88B0A6|nr:protein SPT2 homolog isoform X2 [Gigantopelta aegis]
MDYADLMSILDTAKQKTDDGAQKNKGAVRKTNDKKKAVIVESMTHTFKPARGAKVGQNDKWAEFEEKMKQQKRDAMRKKAEEIKRRLEEEEHKEKEEKERLKQERREEMIREKRKVWEEQFGKKSQDSKKTAQDKTTKHGKLSSSATDRKRTHSISDNEADEDVVSVKPKPNLEKPKKPKIKKFNRPMPPPVNFADILKMAEQKQHETVDVLKKPIQKKKKPEQRPMSQFEKDRLERINSKEYKDWVKHGIGKPPSAVKHRSSDEDSSDDDRKVAKKNSASLSASSSRPSINSVRDRSPAISKPEHKLGIPKKEHSSMISQKRPIPGHEKTSLCKQSEKTSHSSDRHKGGFTVPKISDSSGQKKVSHSSSSNQVSKSSSNSDSVSKKVASHSKENNLSVGNSARQSTHSKHSSSDGYSNVSKKPKISSSSDSKVARPSGPSKLGDGSVHKSSSDGRSSDVKKISKSSGLHNKSSDARVPSTKHSSSSIYAGSSEHRKPEVTVSSVHGQSGSHKKSSSDHLSNSAKASSSHNNKSLSSNHGKSVPSNHSSSASSHVKSSSGHSHSSVNSVKSSSDHKHSGTNHVTFTSKHGQSASNHAKISSSHSQSSSSSAKPSGHPKMQSQKSFNTKHEVSSDKKSSSKSFLNAVHKYSENKMATKSFSGSNQHKVSSSRVVENNHGKPVVKTAERNHKQADVGKLAPRDKHSQSSHNVRMSEKEVNRLKGKGQEFKNRETNNKVHRDKGNVHDSKHKSLSSGDRRDVERSNGKGDPSDRNNYDSVHEKVLICGPSSPEEEKPKKAAAPPASNPWDRIYGEIKKKTPKPVSRKRQIIDSESEDEDMAGFIDDDDDDIEDPSDLDYSKYIKQIFGYDRNRYRDDDGDVDNMESSYASLMKEEARSAKIGLLEDLEDMKREEEEFKQKMMKKKIRRI